MAEAVENFTDANFEDRVEKSDVLTIVDFWAEWCAPCRMLGPTVVEVAEDNGDKIRVGKLNVDDNPETASKFGIRGIPTLLFFKDGQVKEQLVGVRPKDEIQAVVDKSS